MFSELRWWNNLILPFKQRNQRNIRGEKLKFAEKCENWDRGSIVDMRKVCKQIDFISRISSISITYFFAGEIRWNHRHARLAIWIFDKALNNNELYVKISPTFMCVCVRQRLDNIEIGDLSDFFIPPSSDICCTFLHFAYRNSCVFKQLSCL